MGKTLHELMDLLREAAPPPPPPPPMGGPLGGPGGAGPLGGPPGGGLPPPPMGGGLGGPPGGGLGGPPMGGDPMGGGGPQPVKIKTIDAMDVWGVLKKSAEDMDKYDELNIMYDRKRQRPQKQEDIQKPKKTSSLMM